MSIIALVVDDDTLTAEMTAMFLEMAGYETIIADGGIDALDKLSSESAISIVVSDMNMPLMSGLQLFSEMRIAGFKQPFILVTGEEPAEIANANPDIDAVVQKDEYLETALPEIAAKLIENRGARYD